MYESEAGRFLQTDPIGYAGGMNLYAYVGNDPVNFADPLGLDEGGIEFDPSKIKAPESTDGGEIVVTAPRPSPPEPPPPPPPPPTSVDVIGGILGEPPNFGESGEFAGDGEGVETAWRAIPKILKLLKPKKPPKPAKNFKTPTHPPSLPYKPHPNDRVRWGPKTEQYPHGYWRVQRLMPDGRWHYINPRTGRTGPPEDTHIPLPEPIQL